MSTKNTQENNYHTSQNALKLVGFSFIGFFMFFIPLEIMETRTIPLDHIVSWIRNNAIEFARIYALIVITIGAVIPFIKKTWNNSTVDRVFSGFKILGVLVAFMVYFNFGPEWILAPSIGPFLYNALVIPVGLIVPIGSVFLAFLVGYGLLELIGVVMRPVMRPIFKTPGRSAIDAVASFVGSYSLGLVITNRVFKEGKYTIKEASIIATGFSTVSATFMVIVANTLGLMGMWNRYFWSTLLITFLVTAIVIRIWPLNRKKEEYIEGEGHPEVKLEGNIFKNAWNEGLKAASSSKSFGQNIKENIIDGFYMVFSILPSIMSVGLVGLLLAEYTPLFSYVGYIFYPFTLLARIPEPLLAAEAASMGIAEMFLPALMVVEAPLITQFVIGVVCVSSILFFSASIPCIVATEIPISITEMVIIWVERTILTILIAAPVAYLLL